MARRPAAPPTNLRAVIYARVSSEEQAESGYSLDAQLELMRTYAVARGLQVVAEHVAAESARKVGRAVFDKVIASFSGRDAPGHLLIEKIDRVSRNLPDMAKLDDLRLRGLTIHAVKGGRVYGPDSPSGDMLEWEFQAVIARHYVRNLSEEVRKGMKAKRAAGGWPHLAPLGLLNTERDGRRVIVHDPERAPIVARLAKAVAAHRLTLLAACRWAASHGLTTRAGRSFSTSSMQALLRNPLLAGLMVGTSGEMKRCAVEPVVDTATWWRVQDVLSSRTRGKGERGRRHDHAFRGLIRCACGRAYSGEMQPGRHRKGAHVYYRCAAHRCPRGRHPVRERDVIEAVARRLDGLKLTPEMRTFIREEIAAMVEAAQADANAQHRRLDAEAENARKRLATMYQDRLAGRLAIDEFDAMAAGERQRLAAIDTERGSITKADVSWADKAIALCDAAVAAGHGARTLPRERIRPHVRAILAGFIVIRDGAIHVTLHPALEACRNYPNPSKSLTDDEVSRRRGRAGQPGAHPWTLPEPPPPEVWAALEGLRAA